MSNQKQQAVQHKPKTWVELPKNLYKDKKDPTVEHSSIKKVRDDLMVCTLPPHTTMTIDGQEKDVSFHTFFVPAQAVRESSRNQYSMLVSFPRENKDGQPWQVTLRAPSEKQPDGSYEKGQEYPINASALSEAMYQRKQAQIKQENQPQHEKQRSKSDVRSVSQLAKESRDERNAQFLTGQESSKEFDR